MQIFLLARQKDAAALASELLQDEEQRAEVLSLLATGSDGQAQLTKLRAAYSAESSWSLATCIALEGGLYKKYGLDVDLVLIRSASTITSASSALSCSRQL